MIRSAFDHVGDTSVGGDLRAANATRRSPAPLLAATGSAGIDSVADVVNRTAAPFTHAPPPEQGAAGWVAHGLGCAIAAVGAPAAIIDTAFASLTAPVAAAFPALPALTLGAMHVAPPHAHTHPPSFIPPAPPVPLPSIGVTLGSGAVTVLIGGVPAARVGDIGLAVTCGSLAPPFEIVTGSSNVLIGGARAARTLDLTKHCNPASTGPFSIAMAAAAVVAGAAGTLATGSGAAAAQAAADAASLAMKLLCGKDPGLPPGMGAMVGPPARNVIIGGFPCPAIGEMAAGGLMKVLTKAAHKAGRVRNARRANGPCANGSHPVYLPTGENFDSFVDFVSGGLFEWRRHYTTARNRIDGPLGHGWRHWLQRSLSVRLHRATFTDWDGQRCEFPAFRRGSDTARADGYVLRRLGPRRFQVSYLEHPVMEFAGNPWDGELPLHRLVDGGAELEIVREPGRGELVACVERRVGTRDGRRWEFRYDLEGRIIEVVETGISGAGVASFGAAVTCASYAYDHTGDLRRAVDALGGVCSYAHDSAHRHTRQTDPRGYTYSFEYDAQGRCTHASGEDGLWSARMEYLPRKHCTRYTEGEAATWEYRFDADGFVLAIVDPYGGKRVRERDPDGRILREVDAGGRELRWLYDRDGAHHARIDRFGYLHPREDVQPKPNDPHLRALPDTALGRQYAGRFEPSPSAILGLPAAALAHVPEQFRSMFRARASGEVESCEPHEQLDALGRRTRETDVLGRAREWSYDATGNVIAARDRDGRARTQTTVSWNLVGQQEDPLGNAVRFRYSKIEQVVAVVDPLGNSSSYDYDLKERLVAVRRMGRVREQYVYDPGDHLVEKRSGDGSLLFRNEIHENHFVARRSLASGGFHRFDYDPRGRVIEASTAQHDVRLGYDGSGRCILDLRDEAGVRHEDLATGGRRTHVLDRFVLVADAPVLGSTRLVDPSGGETVLRLDPHGLVQRRCSNGTTELAQYDGDGRIERRVVSKRLPSGKLKAWVAGYRYTAEGDLVSVADNVRGTTSYETDAAHRIVSETASGGEHHAFEYDAASNLLAKPGVDRIEIGDGNRLAASGDETFEYDRRDQLAVRRFRDGSTIRYGYDSFDMLVAIDRTDSDGTELPRWSAAYDGLGRRTWCRSGDRLREFYWDRDRLAAEVMPDARLRIYQYGGPEALVPLLFTEYSSRDAEPGSGKTYHVFSNPVGMPLCVEDSQGTIVWWADRIDPYGKIHVRLGNAIEYNLRWPGHYHDPESGLHCNRYRYYSPALGRYLQTDPLGHEGSPVNLYAYCTNPLVDVDVLGLAHPGATDGAPGSRRSDPTDNDGQERPPSIATGGRVNTISLGAGRTAPSGLDLDDGI